jgi:hypothetical protein
MIEDIVQDKLRVGFLAGADKKWDAEKYYMEKKYGTKYLNRQYKVLENLNSDNKEYESITILERTILPFLNHQYIDQNQIHVTGRKSDIETALQNKDISYMNLHQQGNSLTENLDILLNNIYSDGYKGNSLIMAADLANINKSSINQFVGNSYNTIQKNKNIIGTAGLSDIKETRELISKYESLKSTKMKKFGVFIHNDNKFLESDNLIPKLTFGSAYFLTYDFYKNKDEILKKLSPLMDGFKRLFNDRRNLPLLFQLAKGKYDKKGNKINPIKRITKTNLLEHLTSKIIRTEHEFKHNINDYLKISDLNAIVSQYFDINKEFAIIKSPAEFCLDVDDETDLTITKIISKTNL